MADQSAVVAAVGNGAGREALLAEMPFRDAGAAEVVESKAEEAGETAATVETAAEPSDPAEPSAADIEADAAGTDTEDPKPTADEAKRLGLVERAEKRARQQLKAEREAFDEERRTFAADRAAIKAEREKLDAVRKRAKYDPVSVMRELGLTEDDFEHAAQQLFVNSKRGAADPKTRAAAEAAQRDRERLGEFESLKAKVDALEAEKLTATQAARNSELIEQYVGKVTKEISAATSPLAALHLSKSPARAKAMIAAVADELYAEHLEVPTPAEVVAAYETRRRAQLEDEGIDVDALIAKPAAAATTTKPGKTLGASLGSATPPAKPSAARTRADLLKEAVQELESGNARLD